MLNRDILALVHSSQNKFLREIFGLESKESRRGPGSLIRVKAGSQQFKVGSGGPALPGPGGQTGLERPRCQGYGSEILNWGAEVVKRG